MDYVKQYRSFINSYYFAEGIRITAGVTLPAIILNFFGLLHIGIVVSLGALCVSVSDMPGPILHRRNGMRATVIIIFFVSLITGFVSYSPVLLGFLIAIFCFLFSMIGVYNSRVNAIGMSALLVMVLGIQQVHNSPQGIALNALYVAAGGVWYMLLSITLYSFRPYKLIQQALGENIMSVADYLRSRALFYNKQVDYDKVYGLLLEKQVIVQNQQQTLREMLFKSRHIIKESTTTSRTILMIFSDTVDLFEKTTTTFYAYEALHKYFDNTDILERFRTIILEMANELDEIGLSVQSGKYSREPVDMQQHLKELQQYFNTFRDSQRNPENLEALLSLRKILQSLDDISVRLYTLHHYTGYDKKSAADYKLPGDYEHFVTPTDLSWRLLPDNLSLKSNTFRHALRVSIATTAGYILSHIFSLGHGYWILLTIIVILKPAYSLSRERNYQRLAGTIFGALLGLGILTLIKNESALFAIMLLFMIGSYSFMRTRYLFSVIFMTPFVLIMFYLLDTAHFQVILQDRVIDTAIGSVIAFGATFLLVPAWEKEQIKTYMIDAVKESITYYKNVSLPYVNETSSVLDFKISRKNAFVAQANLAGAFSRMLAEPKSKQVHSKLTHQFVVMSNMLNSHIATLSYYSPTLSIKYRSTDFSPVIDDTLDELEDCIAILNKVAWQEEEDDHPELALNKHANELIEKRRTEIQQGLMDTDTRIRLGELKPIIDQFLFISRLAGDLKRTSQKLSA